MSSIRRSIKETTLGGTESVKTSRLSCIETKHSKFDQEEGADFGRRNRHGFHRKVLVGDHCVEAGEPGGDELDVCQRWESRFTEDKRSSTPLQDLTRTKKYCELKSTHPNEHQETTENGAIETRGEENLERENDAYM
ncbi:hypothetical protein M413DRAFT_10086 [Hebeloma cylindrosporum]|uniref:Uncharacterized protein n=1 Tax=Hebeloma cylindrosporum TaxID=76867 RepID=A0A0C2XXY8_HEBCY|nr:hypothetical protein M413DRAFT_10086 [Hebeloma cylindrosporum h7]